MVYRRIVKRLLRRWGPATFLAVAGVVFLTVETVASHPVVGIVGAALMLAYGWLISPALFPASADLASAQKQADAGQAPLVFWKPGCSYCILLRIRVGRAGHRISWVDSSVDEHARALVRSVNHGDHTTPTVLFRDERRTNPDVGWVRSLLP